MDPKTNLDILELPNIFQSLADNQRTGTLKVKSGSNEKSVYFKDGFVQMVHTPLKSTILGEALIKTKSISDETLLKAVEMQKKTNRRFGETLIEMGAITQAQLVAALTFQISEEVCELFTWENIHCEFAPGPPPPGMMSLDEYTSQIQLNAGALMMEAARRIDEWELIKRTLPSTQDVLVLNQKLPAKFKGTLRHELVKWVDGLRDVEEVSERARMSKFNALKTIRDLMEEEYLRTKTAQELIQSAKAVQARGGPREQNIQKIIKLYERAEELGMDNPKLNLWLAKAYERLNQNKESATRYRSLGRESLEKGNLTEAAGHYRKILDMNPEDTDSHEKLTDTYIKLGDIEKAVRQTTELVEKFADLGKAEEALAFASRVREEVGERPDLIKAVAALHLELGDNIQALIEYEAAAEILLEKGEDRKAIAIYEGMLEIDDENIDAHFKLAGAYTRLGETDKAVQRYKALADTLTSSGVLEDSINWQFLINVYENIVAIEPTNVMAREWLVDAYISKGRKDKILENLQGLLDALGEKGDPDKRTGALQKVIEHRPGDYGARRSLARIYQERGLLEDAVSELGEMAHLAVEQGDYDVGLEAFRDILSLDPFDIETVAGIGRIYEIAGRYPEAAQQYKKAGHLYAAASRLGKAARYFRQSAEADPDQNGALLEAAEAERQQGRTNEALELLRSFVEHAVRAKNFGQARSACRLILGLSAQDAFARSVLDRIQDVPDISLDS